MKAYWQKLLKREKAMISVGGIVLISTILYLFVWTPFSSKIESLTSEVKAQKKLVAWMQKTIPVIESYRGQSPTGDSEESLLVLIDNSVKAADLTSYNPRVQQLEENEAIVNFDKASYGRIILWLQKMWHSYHIEVKTLSFVSTREVGVVQAQVTLEK